MSWLSRLFGSDKSAAAIDPVVVDYNGFRITPDPMDAEGGFRLSARIEAEVDGETKTHHLIRADVIRDHDQACEAAILKARQMIDQQGNRIFG